MTRARRLPFLSLVVPLIAPVSLTSVAPARAAEPPQRVFALVVYGDDPCPSSDNPDEIIVCARKPESERYRIPKKLREKPEPQGGPGWGSQVSMMEDAGRSLLPGSCSVNGSYGFTGCTAAMLRQWYAEKRMEDSKGVP
ncbi:MAG: hypothetical protein EP321_14760 [Sphingomonadales bacterium]|nr:MAG: hypothetical protein EP345_07850 [Sphingomonadales bacterium]TNF02085.1 MAG: hypothetical protein EP321_14760 [Sphingomonadales bacterium]